MRYVLDSAVAIKWVLVEADSPVARSLRRDYRAGVLELIAPDVFPVEVAHALTKAERRRRIAVGQAEILLAGVLSSAPVLHPSLSLLPRAVELASDARIGVYDCLYVALAEREGCELVTADERLLKSLPGSSVKLLSSLP